MADETATIEAPGGTTPDAAITTVDTSWQTSIPADYAKDKAWEPLKAKGLPDVLKGYAEAQRLVSSSIRLPGKDAKPDEVARVKAKLAEAGLTTSAPAAPTDYKFDRPDAAEHLGWDEAAETHMRGVWHQAGLSNDQVKAVVNGYAEWQMKRLEMANGFADKTSGELKTEWGAEYDTRLGNAVRFLKTTGADLGIPDYFAMTGVGNDIRVVRYFDRLATKYGGEHTAMDTGTQGTTASDFDRKHQELLAEMGKANPGSPRAQELQANLEALLKQRYPG